MKPKLLIRRLLISAVLLPLAFAGMTLFINLSIFDQALIPELEAILAPMQKPTEQGNAYYAVWGLTATADKDIIQTGTRLVERYYQNRDINGFDELTAEDRIELLGAVGLDEEWKVNYSHCNSRREYGCLARMLVELQSNPAEDPRIQLMLDRHDLIMEMPVFENHGVLTFASPLPAYSLIMTLSKIRLAQSAMADSPVAFLTQLKKEMHFWKMLSTHGSELIDKMVGVAGLWTDMQFLSEYLADHPLSESEVLMAEALLRPLTPDELNVGQAFDAEQRSVYQELSTMGLTNSGMDFGLGSHITGWLVQPNATSNTYYLRFAALLQHLSSLPASEFVIAMQAEKESRKGDDLDHGHYDLLNLWPSSLYNFGGKLFLSWLGGNYSDYIGRVHDINGMIGLVELQLALQSIEVESIENFLETTQFVDPYTGGPMDFEPEGRWLQFVCLEPGQSSCRIKL